MPHQWLLLKSDLKVCPKLVPITDQVLYLLTFPRALLAPLLPPLNLGPPSPSHCPTSSVDACWTFGEDPLLLEEAPALVQGGPSLLSPISTVAPPHTCASAVPASGRSHVIAPPYTLSQATQLLGQYLTMIPPHPASG
jgi:hypothetical protein